VTWIPPRLLEINSSKQIRVRRLKNRGWIACGGIWVVFSKASKPTGSEAQPNSETTATEVLPSEESQPGCEAKHPLPPGAEVKSAWSCTSNPLPSSCNDSWLRTSSLYISQILDVFKQDQSYGVWMHFCATEKTQICPCPRHVGIQEEQRHSSTLSWSQSLYPGTHKMDDWVGSTPSCP
jgi:hypothetical protein